MTLSILEFITYGIIAYSGMLVLIASVIKEIPTTRSLAIVRAMYLIPSIIASGVLGTFGVNIVVNVVTTSNTIKSLNTSQVWTEATTQTNNITLQGPMWIAFHYLLFIVMTFYVIQQILFLLTKPARQGATDEYQP